MSQLAETMNCDLIEVLQGGYFVHGRWGWYAEFQIKRVIAVGFFTKIDYQFDGSIEKETYQVRAFGTRPDGSVAVGTTVSLAMAKAEGWVKNPKYKTMPVLMLKKRAASFLIRETAAHIFGGKTATVEEAEDTKPQTAYPKSMDVFSIDTLLSAPKEGPEEEAIQEDTEEEKQRMEVFFRVEKKIAEKKAEGTKDVVLVNIIGFELQDIEKQPIETLMRIMKDLG
jgi:hypothetical protein